MLYCWENNKILIKKKYICQKSPSRHGKNRHRCADSPFCLWIEGVSFASSNKGCFQVCPTIKLLYQNVFSSCCLFVFIAWGYGCAGLSGQINRINRFTVGWFFDELATCHYVFLSIFSGSLCKNGFLQSASVTHGRNWHWWFVFLPPRLPVSS